MDIKKTMDGVKGLVAKKCKVIIVISIALLGIAILIGLLWPKTLSHAELEETKRLTDINDIYFQHIKNSTIKEPNIGDSIKVMKEKDNLKKEEKDKIKVPSSMNKQINPKEYRKK